MQVRTPLDVNKLADMQAHLSAERLARYVNDCNGDQVAAMALYEWNMAVAEAFYGPLQSLEVMLRNSLGGKLEQQFGPTWYLAGQVPALRHPQPSQLQDALDKLAKRGTAPNHGLVLAELNFGFWSGILSRKYETDLWRPLFRHCFAHGPSKLVRDDVHKRVEQLRLFRNRIAHHEPIYNRNLACDYAVILELAAWLSPFMSTWIDETSRVQLLLADKP